MRNIFLLFAFGAFLKVDGQSTYDTRIEKLAFDIANTFPKEEKVKIGLGSFSHNDQQTRLTQLIYDDLASALVTLSTGNKKILVSSEGKLNTAPGYPAASTEADKALILGKEKSVEYLCFGRITDDETSFKILIKLYETKEGNLIAAFKTTIEKSSQLVTLSGLVIGEKQAAEPITAPHASLVGISHESPAVVKPKKEKKQRENRFLKFLGETAMNTSGQLINSALEKKGYGTTPSNTNSQNNTGSGDTIVDNTPTTPDNGSCRSYVTLVNNTGYTIELKIYKDNPSTNRRAEALYTYTIASGRSKKLRIEKDTEYFYYAHNGSATWGASAEYRGRFEAEECGETIQEEIE
jgi:hypothetical protein